MNDRFLIDLNKLQLCLLLAFASIAGLQAQCDETPVFSTSPTEIERSCHLYTNADFTVLAANVNRCYRVEAASGTIISGSLDARLEAALTAGGELPLATSPCSEEIEICLSGATVAPTEDCVDTVWLSRTFTARNTAPEASPAPASFAQNIIFTRPTLEEMTGEENVTFYFLDNGNGMPVNPAPRPEDFPATKNGQHLSSIFCGYAVTYMDGVRDAGCGNNFTFVRTFNVTDDCSDQSRVFTQVVRVGDQQTTVESPPSMAQNPLFFGTNADCAAVIDTRLTGLTIADICDGSSRLDAYVYINGQLGTAPLGPYRVFSSSEPQNFTDPIPIGQHIIRYLGQDSYGAQTILDIDFEVGDNNRPTAACRQDLTVSLGENGIVSITAETLDQGSTDNCSGVTFTIARSGAVFFHERLTLDCDDFGSIAAILRVTDDTGNNRAECTAQISVTDLQRPTCTAPPSTDITCQAFAENLPINLREVFTADPAGTANLLDVTFGVASGVDNCDSLRLRQFLTGSLSECGNGRFTRSFVVNDQAGFTQIALCQQFINVRPYTAYSLRLPGDQDYDSCADLPTPEDLILGESGCDLLTVSTETDTLADDGTACYQLRLTHTFINWCEYDGGSAPLEIPRDPDNDGNLRPSFYLNIDPAGDGSLTDDKAMLDQDPVNNNGNEIGSLIDLYGSSTQRGHFRYVQLVTVSDNIAPEVDLPTPDNGQAITGDCLGGILLNYTAADDCVVPETSISLDIDAVDRNGDDTINRPDFLEDRQVSPNRFTSLPDGSVEVGIRFLPIGQHLARVQTTDDCGNLTERFILLFVEDSRAPLPDCSAVNNVTLTPDPAFGGITALLASDFIRGPATVCTETPITYSIYREETAAQAGFVPRPGEAQLNLDCSDLGPNILRVYAIAEATGRHDYCNISVTVEATNDICAGRLGIIDGYILTEAGEPMAGVEVFAVADGQEIQILTEDDGYYRFDGLAEGADYTIRPYFNDDPINGLSTFDISLVSAYLTQNQEEELSPYELIAADANNSRAITILDLIEIREILLGIDDDFDNNTSWRFVPADYAFPDPTNPWVEQFPEVAVVAGLSGTQSADFVAIKVGDVNGSADPTNNFSPIGAGSLGRVSNMLPLELQPQNDGTWSLVASNEAELSGIQFSMALPAGAKIVGGIARDFWVVDQDDVLHLSYVPEDERHIPSGMPLIELQLPSNASLLFADDRQERLTPEAYLPDGSVLGLNLVVATRHFNSGLTVFPNPVSARSTLSFDWPVREDLRLELIDASGRLVTKRTLSASSGHNSLPLGVGHLDLQSGVYFVRLNGRERDAGIRIVVSGR
jgi:hypothetical protein